MKLSVLDLSPIPSGSTATQAIKNTISLAQHVERLGYHRYWLAEHHNAAALASSSPEILIAAVGAATSTIRVGSGGIMLPNHSPLKVAESFRVLSAIHPERIDLGIGRAAGTDQKTALALRQSAELLGAEGFSTQLDELLMYLDREIDPGQRFGPIKAIPQGVVTPPVFMLGSGADSAALAASLGLGYAFAFHLSSSGAAETMQTYRREFKPSRWHQTPHAILAIAVLCAASTSEAEELARCGDLAMARFGQGFRDLPFPSPAEARAYQFDADEEVFRREARSRQLIGDPTFVKEKLAELVRTTGADEVMVTTAIHDHEERLRSYTRLTQ